MASGQDTEAILTAIRGVTAVKYADGAAVAMFVYDYILTLEMEIELVWKSKWNWIKYVYLFQRYLPFVDTVFLSVFIKSGNKGASECWHLYFADSFVMIIGMCASEIILTVRVWALWNRDKRMTVLLPVCYAVCIVPTFVAMYFFCESLTFGEAPYPGFRGCFPTGAKRYVVYCWALLLVYNCLIMLLMTFPGLQASIFGNSSLSRTVYKDGLWHYIYLFVWSIINIGISATQPPATRSVIASVERVLHSMLASRVLLHMRDHSRQMEYASDMKMSADNARNPENVILEPIGPKYRGRIL
ncbi:hypothetical protein D9619_007984 [Psilocybe cf. subviscida]|uniref:DUF6533 domain-containing protein n=1 Tax=Psilocybe cf. subviscida TaxID=2480587 RepID=A0A8H5ESV2_9AGAR|nr:hypothetical protein D9619_007984 [Psilocybe cf. subviscida]